MARVLVTGMSGAGKSTLLDGSTAELDGRRPVTELADAVEKLLRTAS